MSDLPLLPKGGAEAPPLSGARPQPQGPVAAQPTTSAPSTSQSQAPSSTPSRHRYRRRMLAVGLLVCLLAIVPFASVALFGSSSDPTSSQSIEPVPVEVTSGGSEAAATQPAPVGLAPVVGEELISLEPVVGFAPEHKSTSTATSGPSGCLTQAAC